MKTIIISAESSKVYKAFLNGEELGAISYPKWFSNNAGITTPGSTYALTSRGFWRTITEVKKGEKVLLECRYTWKGMDITDPRHPNQGYFLRVRGLWKSGYVLLDRQEKVLLTIESEFSWKTWKSSYEITCDDTFGNTDDEMMLVLVAAHFFRMYQASTASGAATTASTV